jgi:hypothetical protein
MNEIYITFIFRKHVNAVMVLFLVMSLQPKSKMSLIKKFRLRLFEIIIIKWVNFAHVLFKNIFKVGCNLDDNRPVSLSHSLLLSLHRRIQIAVRHLNKQNVDYD